MPAPGKDVSMHRLSPVSVSVDVSRISEERALYSQAQISDCNYSRKSLSKLQLSKSSPPKLICCAL